MFEIDMDEELDKFYKDKNRFKNLKRMVDFEFSQDYFDGKQIKMNQPKFKKKLTTSKFVKTSRKTLF